MAREYVIACALPHSLGAEADFNVSLFLSPTVDTVDDIRLEQCPLFLDWADLASGRLTIELSDQAGTIDCVPLLAPIDPAAWRAMFPASTPVRRSEVPDWSGRKWRSFNAKAVHDIAVGLHMATILSDPANPPAPSNHPLSDALQQLIQEHGFFRLEGSRAKGRYFYDESLVTKKLDELVESREPLTFLERRIAAEPDPLMRMALQLHRCRRFYERPETAFDYREEPIAGVAPPRIPENLPEFHTRCGLLGDQPALLRRLGLVIDLKVVDRARLQSSEWLSSRLIAENVEISRSTRVHCHARGDVFTTVPRTADWGDGALRLGDTARFSVLSLDTDGSAIKSERFLWTLPRLLKIEGNGDPVDAATPAQRSPGFTIAGQSQAIRCQDDLGRQIRIAANLESGKDQPLDTEDVVRGLRIDVWDDFTRKWYSLHQRLSTVSIDGIGPVFEDRPEEGFIQGTPAHENVRTENSAIHIHEALFGWEGWSLSAPRPGKRVVHQDGHELLEDEAEPPAAPPHPFHVRTRVRPGTLPRLRYGRAYAFRAWAVDLAGNSRPHDLNPPAVSVKLDDGGAQVVSSSAPGSSGPMLLDATRSVIARQSASAAGKTPTGADPQNLLDPEIADAIVAHIRTRRDASAPTAAFATADRRATLSSAVSKALAADTKWQPTAGPAARITDLDSLVGSQLPALGFGNRGPAAKAIDTVTKPQPFLRWEPVPSPEIVPRHLFTDGESLRVLVIRSGVTQDPDTLEITVGTPGDYAASAIATLPKCGYQATSERHLAPPKITQVQAEFHGMFDLGIGAPSDEDRRKMLGWALRANGTFADEDRADIDNPPNTIPQPGMSIVNVGNLTTKPKSLPLPAGEPPAPGQTIIHNVENLALPYLPDPMARGVAIHFPEAGGDWHLSFPFGGEGFTTDYTGEWPEIEPYRLVLEGSAALAGDVTGRVITMRLPPSDIQLLQAASALRRDQLPLLGPWSCLPPGVTADPDVIEAAADGMLWGLSPFERITLVHAVDRPIEAPRPVRILPLRAPGSTSVTLAGAIDVHGPSTGTLVAEARWSEPIDDLILPELEIRQSGAQAFQTIVGAREDIALLGSLDLTADLPDIGPVQVHRAIQEFSDTRHRLVDYTFRAFTRFREYFHPTLLMDADGVLSDDRQSVVAPSLRLSIPSSAPPPPPVVHSVLPLFRWSDEAETEQPLARRRTRRAGVRIYLERPWYTSGEGELLGIILARSGDDSGYPAPEDGSGFPFVSKWGADPIWSAREVDRRALPSLRLDNLLHLSQLDDREVAARPVRMPQDLPLAVLPDSPLVTVLGYAPQFNRERGLWFVDVAIDPGPQFWPFVRLALCRYQPESIAGAHLSAPVQCDYVQLPPERTASVSRTDDQHVRVVVAGPVGVRSGQSLDLATAVRRNRHVGVRLQRRDPAIRSDLGWETVAVTELRLRGQSGDRHVASWVGELRSDVSIPLSTPGEATDWRVAIEEWELLESDAEPRTRGVRQKRTQPMQRRLVYAADLNF